MHVRLLHLPLSPMSSVCFYSECMFDLLAPRLHLDSIEHITHAAYKPGFFLCEWTRAVISLGGMTFGF